MANSSNNRGNQTKYELELSPDEGVETIGDLFNPGHPDSGTEPRSDLVDIDAGQDISQPAKVTLGNYLGAASKGRVGVSRPNTFQLPAGSNSAVAGFDSNSSGRRPPGATRSAIESDGVTEGTFLDLARGYDPHARSFESTKDSTYSRSGNNPFLDSDISIKDYSDPDARARGQSGNSILLNIKPRGAGSSAQPGNPEVGPLPEDTPLVQQKISEVLKNNRFNPLERTFVQNHTIQGTGTTLQRKLGVYEKDNGKVIRQDLLEKVGLKLMVRATGHGVPGLDLLDSSNSLQRTNNLAPLVPSAPQLTGLPLIDVVNLRAGNVAVAETGLGVGVTPESARAEYINEIYIEGADRTQSDSRGVFTGKSYGVLNSHIEPFGGPLPIGTFTTTVAGIIAIVGTSSLVALLPLLLGGNREIRSRKSTFNADPATLTKGKRAFLNAEADGYGKDNLSDYIISLLGIPKTDHNWGQCLLVGIGAFFGIEIERPVEGQRISIDTDSILESFFDIVTAPGYYAVVIRNAIRDTEQIVRAIEGFADSASDANVIGTISGLFNIVESITTSALYRFIMSMTALGNQVLNYAPRSQNSDLAGYPLIPNLRLRSRMSENTSPSDDDFAVLGINGDLGSISISSLAWKHSAPVSQYILPSSFMSSLDRSSWVDAEKRTPGKLAPSERIGQTSRISSDRVKEIEDRLEGEYVPFYFQDLRTNEIISFHAFLTDLSDGFTASYNSTAGYGRADEVMVYNNTKRSLSFGFQVVATSVEDLDVMYWNVNKLITMLYPQYSRGRTMSSGDNVFVQPFSQIPTASPMIRLRIGDIIRGNYSKFGLARLFGLGQDEKSFSFTTDDAAKKSYERRRRAAFNASLEKATQELQARNMVVGDLVTIKRIARDKPVWCNRQGRAAWTGVELQRNQPRFDMSFGLNTFRPDVPERLVQLIDNEERGKTVPVNTDVRIVEVRSSFNQTISQLAGGEIGSLPSLTQPDESVAVSPDDEAQYLVEFVSTPGGQSEQILKGALGDYKYFYVLKSEILKYNDAVIWDRAQEIFSEEYGDLAAEEGRDDAVAEFFSSAEGKNPIVRAFESTRGRGLAGFITDLKMDWMESTWEIDQGMRAPKSMKLSVTFSPIHDIPMGLDSDGMMRSVAYNVGSMSRVVGRDQYEDAPTPPSSNQGQGGTGT